MLGAVSDLVQGDGQRLRCSLAWPQVNETETELLIFSRLLEGLTFIKEDRFSTIIINLSELSLGELNWAASEIDLNWTCLLLKLHWNYFCKLHVCHYTQHADVVLHFVLLMQGLPQQANLHKIFSNCFTWDTLLDETWAKTCSRKITKLQHLPTELLQLLPLYTLCWYFNKLWWVKLPYYGICYSCVKIYCIVLVFSWDCNLSHFLKNKFNTP